eukprot:1184404-Prorocentrum_minimum.AAC.3
MYAEPTLVKPTRLVLFIIGPPGLSVSFCGPLLVHHDRQCPSTAHYWSTWLAVSFYGPSLVHLVVSVLLRPTIGPPGSSVPLVSSAADQLPSKCRLPCLLSSSTSAGGFRTISD